MRPPAIPRRDARALPWREAPLTALDFETTGLDPRTDGVISFGAVPIEQGRIRLDRGVRRMCDPGIPLRPEVVPIHGIRPADLRGSEPLAAVAPDLAAAVAGRLLVVWTAWVEEAFLDLTLGGGRRRWRRATIDVRGLAVHLDEEEGFAPSPARTGTLEDTARRFGVPLERSHDALADAFVTAQVFVVAAARLEERAGGMTAGRLLRLGRW